MKFEEKFEFREVLFTCFLNDVEMFRISLNLSMPCLSASYNNTPGYALRIMTWKISTNKIEYRMA